MANFYVTPVGAGSKTGADWANAFGTSEYFAYRVGGGGVVAGDIFYVFSGTYTLSANLIWQSGSTSLGFIQDIGISDQDLMTEALGNNRPFVACGVYSIRTAAYNIFKNFEGLGANQYVFFCDTSSVFYNCKCVNTSAAGTTYAIYLVGAYSKAILCEGSAPNDTSGMGINGAADTLALGCIGYDCGYIGVKAQTIIDCIAYNCVKGFYATIRGVILGGTVDNCDVGIVLASDRNIIMNNTISSCDVGVYKSVAVARFYVFLDNNNYYSNVLDVSFDGGITEQRNLYEGFTGYSLDPQFTDAVGHDFSIGENLKALALPSTFSDMINISYKDIGAVQRQEPTTDYPAQTDVRNGVDYDSANLTGSAFIPVANNVRTGVSTDATTGNIVLPIADNVRDSIGYGSLGTELTGNITFPLEAQVLNGVGYGASGLEFAGNVVIDYPSEDDVRLGVDYNSAALTGNVRIPTEVQVQNGIVFGTSDTLTGSLESIRLLRENFKIKVGRRAIRIEVK